ncbi:Exopolysaccharide phosphotransferase, partial [Globisporangium splendens]
MRGFYALLAFAATLALLLFMSEPDPPLGVLELASGGFNAPSECDIANFAQLKKSAIVYTWVNGSEPCYNKRRAKAGLPPGGSSRDKEMGELKYSIRSLLQFAPWLEGPIYIVTPGQIPDWLDTSNPRIRVVDQDDLLPEDLVTLPNFDTNVIEQFLHKIPGLTDTFIHMNDDYLFIKPVKPTRFFTCDGGLQFLSEINHIRHVKGQKSNAWLASVRNTVELADKTYGGEHVYNFLKHAPFVYSRKAFEKIHEKFGKELHASHSHQVRHFEDLNMPLLHHIYMNEEGSRLLNIPIRWNPIAECDDWLLIRVTDTDHAGLEQNFARALQGRGPEILFALNDEYSKPETAALVRKFYGALLPNRASHELPLGQFVKVQSNYHGKDCVYDRAIIPFPTAPAIDAAAIPTPSSLRQEGTAKPSLGLQDARFESFFADVPTSKSSTGLGNLGFLLGIAFGVVCSIYIFRLANNDGLFGGSVHSSKSR